MVIIADTSGLLAVYDRDQREHAAVRRVVEDSGGPLVVTPFMLAETDYLIATRLGNGAQDIFWEDLEQGAYRIARFADDAVAEAAKVARHYRDLRIGITDASLVVAAEQERTVLLLTSDHRHFRAVRPLTGEDAFRLLPQDR